MIRTLAAAGLFLAALVPIGAAGGAAAQTWGQPVYVGPYGRVVGGTPLSEVETRSYVNTGRWADGYSDQVYVYVPAPVYGRSDGRGRGYGSGYVYGRQGYGYDRHDHGRYGYGRYEPRPHQGYRDVWGYNDDRHPSARGGSHRRSRYDHRDCGCGDVYLYDR
ncbi:MAG: hypothetical protein QME55_15125 [Brevundimonas sp.]|uniref:hypothetical protein n=1 Tax=Brevundimonas sp. TaxID=1871086 RepID=UPI0026187297|nr:hypothetical protein [Brevundimonas sp.]MDI6626060.1 hypothetical protein [Brevundimonas sp.]MDQ7813408.1 hypothetical protein [Brevundimonas sp.]